MKAVWQGSISFGLVTVPVFLYAAKEPVTISFHLLHDADKGRIKYERVCKKCGKTVPWQKVVKGFEYKKNKYYVFTKKKLEKLKPEKSGFIDLVAFTDAKTIDPLFFDHFYFAAPQHSGDKAFFLLKQVLEETAKAAVGRFVMREKEYTCIIEAYKQGLLLTTLNYAYEIRDINKLEVLKKKPRLSKKEVELARELIKKLTREIDITKFKDTFAEQLKELILADIKGEKIPEKKAKKAKKTLMEALKASVK